MQPEVSASDVDVKHLLICFVLKFTGTHLFCAVLGVIS